VDQGSERIQVEGLGECFQEVCRKSTEKGASRGTAHKLGLAKSVIRRRFGLVCPFLPELLLGKFQPAGRYLSPVPVVPDPEDPMKKRNYGI
jgi:hypothetical protein